MQPKEIQTETARKWREAFKSIQRPNQYNRKFQTLLRAHEREAELDAKAHLQPWLHLLEESIQWLTHLTLALDELNAESKLTRPELSAWALIGASCGYAVTVRRLVLSGLDTPARAAARSLDEHLSACIAVLYDRGLAERFQICETDREISDFWYNNLSPKKICKHLNAVERSVGLDQEASQEMRAWRAQEVETFSQAAHPSYLGAALTTLTLSAKNPDLYGSAFLGMASLNSERTLNFACKSIWYFSCFGFLMLFNNHANNSPVIPFDKENVHHQMVIIGRDIIQYFNKKYWDHNIYVLPET